MDGTIAVLHLLDPNDAKYFSYIPKKYCGCPRENRLTRMRCQKRFNWLKFQNIILSVADSGIINRLTLQSVII